MECPGAASSREVSIPGRAFRYVSVVSRAARLHGWDGGLARLVGIAQSGTAECERRSQPNLLARAQSPGPNNVSRREGFARPGKVGRRGTPFSSRSGSAIERDTWKSRAGAVHMFRVPVHQPEPPWFKGGPRNCQWTRTERGGIHACAVQSNSKYVSASSRPAVIPPPPFPPDRGQDKPILSYFVPFQMDRFS